MITLARTSSRRSLWLALAMCTLGGGLPTAVRAQSAFSVTLQSDELENQGTVVFLIRRSGNTEERAVVHYRTEDGTATGAPGSCPADYQSVDASRTFFPGDEEHEIWIIVCDETTHETDETFGMRLTVTDPDHSVTEAVAQATILNDDPQPNIAWAPTPTFAEGNSGSTSFDVVGSLTSDSEVPVSFDYTVGEPVGSSNSTQPAIGGSGCAPGVDFLEASRTAEFASGVAEVSIPVALCGDTEIEPVERGRVAVRNVQGATSPGSVAFLIGNDDEHLRPTVTSLDPNTIQRWVPSSLASEAPVFVRVFGQDFHADAEVLLNQTPLVTTFVGAAELAAEVPLFGLASGDHPVTVQNPDPSPGPSPPRTLTLRRTNVNERVTRPIREVVTGLVPLRPDLPLRLSAPVVSPESLRLRPGRTAVVNLSGSGLTGFDGVEVLFNAQPTSLVDATLLNVTATTAELEIGASLRARPGTYEVVLLGVGTTRVTLPLTLTVGF